jgi:hypothetical protein
MDVPNSVIARLRMFEMMHNVSLYVTHQRTWLHPRHGVDKANSFTGVFGKSAKKARRPELYVERMLESLTKLSVQGINITDMDIASLINEMYPPKVVPNFGEIVVSPSDYEEYNRRARMQKVSVTPYDKIDDLQLATAQRIETQFGPIMVPEEFTNALEILIKRSISDRNTLPLLGGFDAVSLLAGKDKTGFIDMDSNAFKVFVGGLAQQGFRFDSKDVADELKYVLGVAKTKKFGDPEENLTGFNKPDVQQFNRFLRFNSDEYAPRGDAKLDSRWKHYFLNSDSIVKGVRNRDILTTLQVMAKHHKIKIGKQDLDKILLDDEAGNKAREIIRQFRTNKGDITGSDLLRDLFLNYLPTVDLKTLNINKQGEQVDREPIIQPERVPIADIKYNKLDNTVQTEQYAREQDFKNGQHEARNTQYGNKDWYALKTIIPGIENWKVDAEISAAFIQLGRGGPGTKSGDEVHRKLLMTQEGREVLRDWWEHRGKKPENDENGTWKANDKTNIRALLGKINYLDDPVNKAYENFWYEWKEDNQNIKGWGKYMEWVKDGKSKDRKEFYEGPVTEEDFVFKGVIHEQNDEQDETEGGSGPEWEDNKKDEPPHDEERNDDQNVPPPPYVKLSKRGEEGLARAIMSLANSYMIGDMDIDPDQAKSFAIYLSRVRGLTNDQLNLLKRHNMKSKAFLEDNIEGWNRNRPPKEFTYKGQLVPTEDQQENITCTLEEESSRTYRCVHSDLSPEDQKYTSFRLSGNDTLTNEATENGLKLDLDTMIDRFEPIDVQREEQEQHEEEQHNQEDDEKARYNGILGLDQEYWEKLVQYINTPETMNYLRGEDGKGDPNLGMEIFQQWASQSTLAEGMTNLQVMIALNDILKSAGVPISERVFAKLLYNRQLIQGTEDPNEPGKKILDNLLRRLKLDREYKENPQFRERFKTFNDFVDWDEQGRQQEQEDDNQENQQNDEPPHDDEQQDDNIKYPGEPGWEYGYDLSYTMTNGEIYQKIKAAIDADPTWTEEQKAYNLNKLFTHNYNHLREFLFEKRNETDISPEDIIGFIRGKWVTADDFPKEGSIRGVSKGRMSEFNDVIQFQAADRLIEFMRQWNPDDPMLDEGNLYMLRTYLAKNIPEQIQQELLDPELGAKEAALKYGREVGAIMQEFQYDEQMRMFFDESNPDGIAVNNKSHRQYEILTDRVIRMLRQSDPNNPFLEDAQSIAQLKDWLMKNMPSDVIAKMARAPYELSAEQFMQEFGPIISRLMFRAQQELRPRTAGPEIHGKNEEDTIHQSVKDRIYQDQNGPGGSGPGGGAPDASTAVVDAENIPWSAQYEFERQQSKKAKFAKQANPFSLLYNMQHTPHEVGSGRYVGRSKGRIGKALKAGLKLGALGALGYGAYRGGKYALDKYPDIPGKAKKWWKDQMELGRHNYNTINWNKIASDEADRRLAGLRTRWNKYMPIFKEVMHDGTENIINAGRYQWNRLRNRLRKPYGPGPGPSPGPKPQYVETSFNPPNRNKAWNPPYLDTTRPQMSWNPIKDMSDRFYSAGRGAFNYLGDKYNQVKNYVGETLMKVNRHSRNTPF